MRTFEDLFGSVSYEKLLTFAQPTYRRWASLWLIEQMQLRLGGQSVEMHRGPRTELVADRGSALSSAPKPAVNLVRQLLASIFTLLLTASITLGLDTQTKAEIDKFTAYVQASGVRFIRNGLEYSGAEDAQRLPDNRIKVGDRVETIEDFITDVASKSFSGKPHLAKFADSHTHSTGEWWRAPVAAARENKR
jgi:Family of unknown function (DUF5329)